MNTKVVGQSGEDLACRFLKKSGYEIIERNYTCPYGEIDIVAAEGGYLTFVEVKLRYSDEHGRASEAVNFHKQRKISQTASNYLTKHRKFNVPVRFDVVEVYVESKKINLIRNAFDSYLRY